MGVFAFLAREDDVTYHRTMVRISASFALLLLLGLAPVVLAAQPLEDQFGKDADPGAFAGKGGLLIWSDLRDAAELIEAWDQALRPEGQAPGAVPIMAVCDLGALPFFIPRASVTGTLRRDHPDLSLSLDWKGEAAKRWSPPRSSVTVLVFGPGGKLLAMVSGPASPAGLERVKAALRGP